MILKFSEKHASVKKTASMKGSTLGREKEKMQIIHFNTSHTN